MPTAPTKFDETPRKLADSIWAWIFATLEVLFHMGEDAIEPVTEIAFRAGRDWSKPVAFAVLCRWAATGLQADSLTRRIARELPRMPFKSMIPCLSALKR
jgi:hypothetical protein